MVSFLEQVDILANNLKEESLDQLLQLPSPASSNGKLSAFWMSYVDIVERIVLGLLRASREGDWDLHLHSI